MIVQTRDGHNVSLESRDQEWGNSWLIPQAGYQWLTASGVPVTNDTAMGLPAVSNVMRSASEVIASLPFCVYRGTAKGKKAAMDSWQWNLLHEEPDELATGTFQFFYDLNMSLEGTQNAFVQKIKSRTRVEALTVIDPMRVKVYRDPDTQEKLFDVYVSPTKTVKGLTSDDILHIRGFSQRPGDIVGVSLLKIHREALGVAIALQGFEGDYFKNSGVPPFWFTGAKNAGHAKELLAAHNAEHQGTGRQFRAGALWGDNIDVKSLPISLQDTAYIQAKQMGIEDVCRIWRWPKEFMENTTMERLPQDESAWQARIVKYYLFPRTKRIERAFAADKDLFIMSGLTGTFDLAELERADFPTRMTGWKDARQGGWITANEIREPEGLPPHPDGDTILMTPTGSAPNPESGNNSASGDNTPAKPGDNTPDGNKNPDGGGEGANENN